MQKTILQHPNPPPNPNPLPQIELARPRISATTPQSKSTIITKITHNNNPKKTTTTNNHQRTTFTSQNPSQKKKKKTNIPINSLINKERSGGMGVAWRGDQQSKVGAKQVDGRARWLTRRVGGIACGR